MLFFRKEPHESASKSVVLDHARSFRTPCWTPTQRTHHGLLRCRNLHSDLTWDDPAEMWTYNFLRTKHFHEVSSASPHVYSLKSRYGKVRPLRSLATNKPSPSNYEQQLAWLVSGSSRASAPRLTTCSHRSMAGSRRALAPLICKRQRHCSRRWRNATPTDMSCLPSKDG
jgi:hypothetical protein